MRSVAIVIALAACGHRAATTDPVGGGAGSGSATAVAVDAAVELSKAQRGALDHHAGELQRVVEGLHSDVYAGLKSALVELHATSGWKARRKKANAYEPFDPKRVDDFVEKLGLLAASYERTANALRAADATPVTVADALDQLASDLTNQFVSYFAEVSPDLANEIQFDRAAVCPPKNKEPACGRMGALTAAFEAWSDLTRDLRGAIDDAAKDAQDVFAGELDEHARTALSRTLGEGPRGGEACGPEKLCAWDFSCAEQTGTCERACSQGAMQPCPTADLACVTVDALGGSFCRLR